MKLDREEFREIIRVFQAESDEHLRKLEEGLLFLEKNPGEKDIIKELFREAHSLKGAARVVGLDEIEQLAHGVEDLLGDAQRDELPLTAANLDLVYKRLDEIKKILSQGLDEPEHAKPAVSTLDLRGHQAQEKPPSPLRPRRVAAPLEQIVAPDESAGPASYPGETKYAIETIRVSTRKLDVLMNQTGELLVARLRIQQRLEELDALARRARDDNRHWNQLKEPLRRLEKHLDVRETGKLLSALRARQEHSAILSEGLDRFRKGLTEDNQRLVLISNELEENIRKARMLPFATVFNLFPRMIRDLAREFDKRAELVVFGGEVEVDKRILEEIKDPLTHLLRNSIDHGIEEPQFRQQAGKLPEGTLRLSAFQSGSQVIVEVADDGRGVDLDVVRQTAVKKGLVNSRELENWSDRQVLQLIFISGFSTGKIITDVSGRGVGLDVVKNNIDRLKGLIEVDSKPGVGTRFMLRFPVTLTTTRVLMLKVRGQNLAIPSTGVHACLMLEKGDIFTLEGRRSFMWQGLPITLVPLDRILELEHLPATAPVESDRLNNGRYPVVVVGSDQEQVGFVVDELSREEEVVVKSLGRQLERVRNVWGATVLASGALCLILNVSDLVRTARRISGELREPEAARAEALPRTRNLLVAEDSITTRTILKNILEAEGFNVEVAVDGLDALNKLQARAFDLLVSDVQMPNMDGFELSIRLRREERFRSLPIILVTSLQSDEDKRRGVEAGVDAYITKGTFEQTNLLRTIRRLL